MQIKDWYGELDNPDYNLGNIYASNRHQAAKTFSKIQIEYQHAKESTVLSVWDCALDKSYRYAYSHGKFVPVKA